MKAIDYAAPTTVAEAVALFAQRGERARALAGGTDLIVQVREDRRDLDLLVDIKNIQELNELTFDPSKGLRLGAAVPCYRLTEHPDLGRAYPGLLDGASLIGGVQIQSRASVGGNLCNASPAADSIPPLLALEAVAVIAGPGGTRELPVEQFCVGPGRSALKTGEFLVRLHLPAPQPHSGSAYLRFIPRNEMDIAVVGVGVALTLDGTKCRSARIALGAVGPTPILAGEAGAALAGTTLSDADVSRAAQLAQAAARPISDMRGDADYRRHLVGVLVKRALAVAVERAKGGCAVTKKMHIQTTINGKPAEFLCEPRQSLLEVLRDELRLTGSKEGCNNGNCGACNVLLDGRLVNACLVLGVEVQGRTVGTIEGLAGPQGLHPLQQKFLEHAALQCGICTPGFLVAAKALLERTPHPTEAQVRHWLAGNLCRCTGYDKIIRAVLDAAAVPPSS